ncbi:hypothetical protein AAFF_G00420060 [Aldrovandia affinis]|uniref:Uncharacterized protein n=1 Tax=Aldrovandia affinis TaxID=143900 RepID=A0AAD7SA58_9TELE|nr:hypothetical protein AAFF_G00420060 [Aldrovandia affinis]
MQLGPHWAPDIMQVSDAAKHGPEACKTQHFPESFADPAELGPLIAAGSQAWTWSAESKRQAARMEQKSEGFITMHALTSDGDGDVTSVFPQGWLSTQRGLVRGIAPP